MLLSSLTLPRLLHSTTNSEPGLATAYMYTKDQIVGVGQGMEEEQIKQTSCLPVNSTAKMEGQGSFALKCDESTQTELLHTKENLPGYLEQK